MLEVFFAPKAVAVIGASRDPHSVGYSVLANVVQGGFPGQVYPVNPRATEIAGLRAYPSVLDIPGPVDLAIVVVPAPLVASVMDQCGRKGVKGAVVISAGFRETGHQGLVREQEVVEAARRYGMRLLGPNVLGIIDTISRLNASFAGPMPPKGPIAFMSQSGALLATVLDISRQALSSLAFSHVLSLGNKADLNEVDFLRAWADDPNTRVIMAYLEDVVDGRAFMDAGRYTTRRKPVVAIKSGITAAGSRAAASHTGSLAGSEQAYSAAFRQSGVIRAATVEDLFDYSTALAYQPLPQGDTVAIVTNAGGPGILATDACERYGLRVATLSPETATYLRGKLPPASSVYNPVDVLGDAHADRYALALESVLRDANVSAAVVILTPQIITEPVQTAQEVVSAAKRYGKPVLGCFMGGALVAKGVEVLVHGGVPNYPIPERAVAALGAMWRYRQWVDSPPLQAPSFPMNEGAVRRILDAARADGRVALMDFESLAVLSACGVRVPRMELVETPEAAMDAARRIGFPVVMKIASPDILHKSDVGGVVVGVSEPEQVRRTFDEVLRRARSRVPGADIWGVTVQEQIARGKEVIVGMSRDAQFGPMLMFGLGGIYVEVLRDVSFRIAPLSEREAREMVEEVRSSRLLAGVRGEPPSDVDAVVETILRVSQLVTRFPEIAEMDINPLVVGVRGEGCVALDARMAIASL